MRSIREALAGLVRSTRSATNDPVPAPQPARMILGGPNAPELIMIATDGNIETAADGLRVVQLKADGIAALYVDGRVVSAKTGEPLHCADHCAAGLQRLEATYGHPMVFAGEYEAVDGFNATLAEHKRGQGDGTFWVYDAIPHGAWVTGRDYEVGTLARLDDLAERFEHTSVGHFVGRLDHWVLGREATRAKFAEVVAAGYEGIVEKLIDAPYSRRRSSAWKRHKKLFTVDGRIVDMIGRADGTLKSMIVRTDIGPVNVAAGWSAAEGRTMLAAFVADLTPAAMWAEISFEMSSGMKRAVRGARFHRIRDSKGAL